MSNCYFCKGKTKIKNVDIDFRWGDRLFVVKNVPLEICIQCGERYYSEEISKRLDRLVEKQLQSKIKIHETLKVPVFSWH